MIRGPSFFACFGFILFFPLLLPRPSLCLCASVVSFSRVDTRSLGWPSASAQHAPSPALRKEVQPAARWERSLGRSRSPASHAGPTTWLIASDHGKNRRTSSQNHPDHKRPVRVWQCCPRYTARMDENTRSPKRVYRSHPFPVTLPEWIAATGTFLIVCAFGAALGLLSSVLSWLWRIATE